MDNQLERYEKLLLKNGLKRTAARLQVLNILSGRDSATSQPFLENLVGKEVDRVTLYRILKALRKKGLFIKFLMPRELPIMQSVHMIAAIKIIMMSMFTLTAIIAIKFFALTMYKFLLLNFLKGSKQRG